MFVTKVANRKDATPKTEFQSFEGMTQEDRAIWSLQHLSKLDYNKAKALWDRGKNLALSKGVEVASGKPPTSKAKMVNLLAPKKAGDSESIKEYGEFRTQFENYLENKNAKTEVIPFIEKLIKGKLNKYKNIGLKSSITGAGTNEPYMTFTLNNDKDPDNPHTITIEGDRFNMNAKQISDELEKLQNLMKRS